MYQVLPGSLAISAPRNYEPHPII